MQKTQTAFLIIIAALFIGIYLASERIKTLERNVAAYEVITRAHNEAKRAEALSDASTRIDTIRDTIYRTRTRTEIVWRDRIVNTPPDSVVYVRLDSCLEIGGIVLHELALCDSSNTLKDSAIASYALAVAGMDSALIKTQANAVRFKRQRNWAIGAAVAGWVAFLVK